MYPIIEFFNQEIHVYRVFMFLSIGLAMVVSIPIFNKLKYSKRYIGVVLTSIVSSFIIGARVFNYIVNYKEYVKAGNRIWEFGFWGFSLYGGLIGTLLAVVVIHRVIRKDFWLFLDYSCIPFSIAFIMMRIGCFLNGCCYGKFTKLPWGIPLSERKQATLAFIIGKQSAFNLRVHPTQVYELLCVLVVLPIIIRLVKKNIKSGLVAIGFFIYFTLIRLIILPLRDLPYSNSILTYYYPGFYVLLIIFGIIMLRSRIKSDAVNC